MKNKSFFLVLLLMFCALSVDAQCAMCRAVLESGENEEMAKGINNGIMYLMVFPYLLVGGIGYIIYRSRKKAKSPQK